MKESLGMDPPTSFVEAAWLVACAKAAKIQPGVGSWGHAG